MCTFKQCFTSLRGSILLVPHQVSQEVCVYPELLRQTLRYLIHFRMPGLGYNVEICLPPLVIYLSQNNF